MASPIALYCIIWSVYIVSIYLVDFFVRSFLTSLTNVRFLLCVFDDAIWMCNQAQRNFADESNVLGKFSLGEDF